MRIVNQYRRKMHNRLEDFIMIRYRHEYQSLEDTIIDSFNDLFGSLHIYDCICNWYCDIHPDLSIIVEQSWKQIRKQKAKYVKCV